MTAQTLETTLHYYYFDTKQPDQKQQYQELTEKLKGRGLKLFDSISPSHHDFYNYQIKPLDGQIITLETKYLFNNQWNTAPTPTSEKRLKGF